MLSDQVAKLEYKVADLTGDYSIERLLASV